MLIAADGTMLPRTLIFLDLLFLLDFDFNYQNII